MSYQGFENFEDGMDGLARIASERRRQIDVNGENYDSVHDDAHGDGELALAAALYAACAAGKKLYEMKEYADSYRFVDPWPWESSDDKRPYDFMVENKDLKSIERLRLLEKAGALIAAEIDCLLRKKIKDALAKEDRRGR